MSSSEVFCFCTNSHYSEKFRASYREKTSQFSEKVLRIALEEKTDLSLECSLFSSYDLEKLTSSKIDVQFFIAKRLIQESFADFVVIRVNKSKCQM